VFFLLLQAQAADTAEQVQLVQTQVVLAAVLD
jgi:hypothetical protein